jgi:putative restriction endonuclease
MLLAGHIKPWRDSSHRERLDLSNGLAGCPSHDVAFDTGLLTVEDDLRIRLSASLSEAVEVDQLARQYYGTPPMLTTLRLPQAAQRPGAGYLEWHRSHVFADRRPTARNLPGGSGPPLLSAFEALSVLEAGERWSRTQQSRFVQHGWPLFR